MYEIQKNEKYYSELYKFTQYDIIILKEIIKLNQPFKALDISYKCKCPASTVYSSLKRLEKKGIVKKNEITNKFYCVKKEELKQILKSHTDLFIEYLYKD
ncbi:MAG: helix-turn-helix domain-containing protein [Candidatus Helarchaeota archaeon]